MTQDKRMLEMETSRVIKDSRATGQQGREQAERDRIIK